AAPRPLAAAPGPRPQGLARRGGVPPEPGERRGGPRDHRGGAGLVARPRAGARRAAAGGGPPAPPPRPRPRPAPPRRGGRGGAALGGAGESEVAGLRALEARLRGEIEGPERARAGERALILEGEAGALMARYQRLNGTAFFRSVAVVEAPDAPPAPDPDQGP